MSHWMAGGNVCRNTVVSNTTAFLCRGDPAPKTGDPAARAARFLQRRVQRRITQPMLPVRREGHEALYEAITPRQYVLMLTGAGNKRDTLPGIIRYFVCDPVSGFRHARWRTPKPGSTEARGILRGDQSSIASAKGRK